MNLLRTPLLAALLTALLTSSAAANAADRPNILFIIFDDAGWQHFGAYGCDWVETPNFDRIAEEGALFRNCFTSNPKCSPCRATILTGRNTWQLEEAACHNGLFTAKFAVYPDLLEQAGYYVGLTGKGWGPGDFREGGFPRNPAGPSFDKHKQQPPAKGIGRNDYARNFDDFLSQRPEGKPFCFWMGFSEPHRAYEEGSGQRLGKSPADVVVPGYYPDTPIVRTDLLDYSIEVEYGDQQIGKALAVLEAAGELDNTLILVTSDHGMPFPRVKGQIYEDGFHLPLVIRWGNTVKRGRVVDDFINVRDFAPTFLELAGVPIHEQISGKSLVNILRSAESGSIENRDVMLVGKERHDLGRPFNWGYPVRAIRTPEWFYVHNYQPDRWPAGDPETDYGNVDGSPTKELLKHIGGYFYHLSFGKRPADELYRIGEDPECLVNLANDPFYQQTMEQLRERMLAMLREEKDPRALGNGAIFDTYEYLGGGGNKAYSRWIDALPTELPESKP